jgi:SAM-dependent methyltransferase
MGESMSITAGCPVCGRDSLHDFLKLERVPVHVGVVWPSREAAQAAPTGLITMAYCAYCGFITNRTFEPALMDYAPGYEVSLHHSPVYQAFVAATVEQLVEQYAVRGKLVIEVGCGRGYYLRELCRRGGNRGIGVDPSLDAAVTVQDEVVGLEYVRGLYDESWANVHADCVVCRHVLQHIADPFAFVQMIRQTNVQRPETLIYFELPNSAYVFETSAAWNIFYEHCAYLSPDLLRRMFTAAGCEVLDCSPCYAGGQYMNLFAVVGEGQPQPLAPQASGQGVTPATLLNFGSQHRARVERKRELLLRCEREGKTAVAWGSGGRGVTFLNSMEGAGGIEYVVDINPERQQKYVPGSVQCVVAPDALRQIRPDVIVLTNPTYRDEIQNLVQSLGLAPDYMDV